MNNMYPNSHDPFQQYMMLPLIAHLQHSQPFFSHIRSFFNELLQNFVRFIVVFL